MSDVVIDASRCAPVRSSMTKQIGTMLSVSLPACSTNRAVVRDIAALL